MNNFILFLFLAFILTQLPLIIKWAYQMRILALNVDTTNRLIKLSSSFSSYFKLLNTLIHELGHIFTAYATFNKGVKIDLTSDSAGLATTATRNKLSRIIITLGGYTSASLFVVFYMSMLNLELYSNLLYIVGGILIFSLIFFIRNAFGVYWGLLMTAIVLLVGRFGSEELMINVIILIGALLIVESVASTIVLLKIALQNPNEFSDAQALNEYTKIPTVFWAIFFVLFSFLCTYIGISVGFTESFDSVSELLNYILNIFN